MPISDQKYYTKDFHQVRVLLKYIRMNTFTMGSNLVSTRLWHWFVNRIRRFGFGCIFSGPRLLTIVIVNCYYWWNEIVTNCWEGIRFVWGCYEWEHKYHTLNTCRVHAKRKKININERKNISLALIYRPFPYHI